MVGLSLWFSCRYYLWCSKSDCIVCGILCKWMHPCNSEPYCDLWSYFICQTGQDLLFTHLVHNMGMTSHCHGHLLHHLAQIRSLGSCQRSRKRQKTNNAFAGESSDFRSEKSKKIHQERWTRASHERIRDVKWHQKDAVILFFLAMIQAKSQSRTWAWTGNTRTKSKSSIHKETLLIVQRWITERDTPTGKA